MKPNNGTEGVGGSGWGSWDWVREDLQKLLWPRGRRIPCPPPPNPGYKIQCLACDSLYENVGFSRAGLCPECKKVIAAFKAILVEEKKLA
jgi:hypothetical protein